MNTEELGDDGTPTGAASELSAGLGLRASTQNGPGEPLTFRSIAEQHLRGQAAAYEAKMAEANGLLRDLAQVCTEVNDHTPQSWTRAILRIGNAATVLLRPNA